MPENMLERQISDFLALRGFTTTRQHVGTFVPYRVGGRLAPEAAARNIVRIGEEGMTDWWSARPNIPPGGRRSMGRTRGRASGGKRKPQASDRPRRSWRGSTSAARSAWKPPGSASSQTGTGRQRRATRGTHTCLKRGFWGTSHNAVNEIQTARELELLRLRVLSPVHGDRRSLGRVRVALVGALLHGVPRAAAEAAFVNQRLHGLLG
jgi:hypothetical protein